MIKSASFWLATADGTVLTSRDVTQEDNYSLTNTRTLDVCAYLFARNTSGSNQADFVRCGPDNADAGETTANGALRILARACGFNGTTFDRIRSRGIDSDGVSVNTLGVLETVANLGLFNGTTVDRARSTGDDSDSITPSSLGIQRVIAPQFLFDGNSTVFRRARCNYDVTILTSSARTATTQSGSQSNINFRGAIFIVDVTAITDTPSVTFNVQVQDPVSGGWEDIFTGDTAITAVQKYIFHMYPGIDNSTGAANLDQRNLALPRFFRIEMVHADADSITYSVAALYIL